MVRDLWSALQPPSHVPRSGDIHDKKCQEEKRRFSLTFPDAAGGYL
jgi:hypothetical protein